MSIKLLHGDCLEQMKTLSDSSIDMVLTDPPYVNMVSESWDNLTEKQATEFYDKIINECYRVLRWGGRMILFGSNDTLRYYYNNIFLHRELLVIHKDSKKVSAGRNTRQYKQHINCSEYIHVNTKFARDYTRKLLLECQDKYKIPSKEINNRLGVKSNGGGMWSIYTGINKCKQVPTNDKWDILKEIFNELPSYSQFAEVFNNDKGIGNILFGYNFNFKHRLHPTQKPLDLMSYIISRYSLTGETVLDFTMGSGTTGVACVNLGRSFVGIERDDKYFAIASDRIAQAQSDKQQELFNA